MRQSLQKLNTRILALAMAVLLMISVAPAVSAAEDSGSCGKNLEWCLSGDVLTITGSGAMYDYPESTMAPWYDYRREIARVQLPDGLTRIGNLAFYECSALEFVTLPDSVTEVGWHAFDGCTSMTMLGLGSSLKTIGDGAFRECTALVSVRLPESLTSIGERGFYRCGSLTEITIPASVKKLGNSTFAYCYDLVRADVRAQISELPAWTFYGCSRLTDVILPATLTSVGELAFYQCDSLSNVVYAGSEENKEQIDEDIERNLAGERNKPTTIDDSTGTVSGGSQSGGSSSQSGGSQSGGSSSQSGGSQSGGSTGNTTGGNNNQSTSETIYEGNNGDVTGSSITTEQTDNASVSYTLSITYYSAGGSSTSAHVNVTLESGEAWDEVEDKVLEAVEQVDSAAIDIYIKDDSTLPSGALEVLAGKNVTVTIHNATGSVWKINCAQMEESNKEHEYDLSYERTNATLEQLELLGCSVGYQIRFASDAQVNAEVLIKLPVEHARKNASLYQIKFGGGKELLQTVVVDNAGYAHFYLASVERSTVYLIGIDVQEVAPEEAIIPEVLYKDYGVSEQLSNMEYVVTGRTSSWGVSLNQVTFILAIVMVAAVVIVGCVMYALNKRKLRMGYVPDLDEDYE